MSEDHIHELLMPFDVYDAEIAREFIRFWVVDGIDKVALNIGGFVDNSDEPYLWGSIMADISWHAINGMMQQDPSRGSEADMLTDLKKGFEDRLSKKPGFVGSILGGKDAH